MSHHIPKSEDVATVPTDTTGAPRKKPRWSFMYWVRQDGEVHRIHWDDDVRHRRYTGSLESATRKFARFLMRYADCYVHVDEEAADISEGAEPGAVAYIGGFECIREYL